MTIQRDWEASERPAAPAELLDWAGDALHPPTWCPAAMPRGKRVFDISLAVILLIPLSVVMGVVAVLLLIRQGRPILYAAPRMRGPEEEFTQWKFRTMVCDQADSGASGAHKSWRITPLGRVLRKTRIDELPQLFNILRGDMSFVGPRPPLREYVERFPREYACTLQCRPGVTGLATLIYHRHEDAIMAGCSTAEATEAAYYRRCLPMKFRIDAVYLRHQGLRFDLWIIWQTLLTVLTDRDVIYRQRMRLARTGKRRRAPLKSAGRAAAQPSANGSLS